MHALEVFACLLFDTLSVCMKKDMSGQDCKAMHSCIFWVFIVIPTLIILVAEARLHTYIKLHKWCLLVQTFRNVYRRIRDEDM